MYVRNWFVPAMLLGLVLLVGAAAADDDAATLTARARQAGREGRLDEAAALCGRALALDADHADALYVRATVHSAAGGSAAAVADLDRLLVMQPEAAEFYDLRGSERFKLGKVVEALGDFDRCLELRPERRPHHWRRGIACYYAGRFAEGQRQFEGYQTVDENDVENAVWRYLCMAPVVGTDQAREALLTIRDDRRVPMMHVYGLYAGRLTADDVLEAARAGGPLGEEAGQRLFYAHLYIGLYLEAHGKGEEALRHVKRAAEDYRIGHYMWDVARVHVQLRQPGQ